MNRFENKTIWSRAPAAVSARPACGGCLPKARRSPPQTSTKKSSTTSLPNSGEVTAFYGAGVDVSNRDQVAAFVSGAVQRFGKLHGSPTAPASAASATSWIGAEVWRRVLSVNLEGTFNMCQAFARAAKEAQTPAAIVNLTSVAGIRGVPNRLPYAASEYGVVGITQTMALEPGPLGIRVNAAAPGMIRTPLTESMFKDPENVQRSRRGSSDWPRGPARRGRRGDRLSPLRRRQFRHRCGSSGRWAAPTAGIASALMRFPNEGLKIISNNIEGKSSPSTSWVVAWPPLQSFQKPLN